MKSRSLVIIIFCSINLFIACTAKSDTSTLDSKIVKSRIVESNPISDGPYVFEKDGHREVKWICNGHKQLASIDLEFPKRIQECGHEITLWEPIPLKNNATEIEVQLEYEGDFRVVAASDIHGQYDLFIKLLKINDVLDDKSQWNLGNGHLVITGDVFDRGPQVIKALWFLYDLEKQAEQAGGKVHLLLGNHEVMVLNGDLRYLNDKYVQVAKIMQTKYQDLFSKGSVLGNWLRSRPVLIKVNKILFTHGGFNPKLAQLKMPLDEINRIFKANLVKDEMDIARSGIGKYLHRKNGLIWYRGYFRDNELSKQDISLLLNHFDVTHIVVGHTTQNKIKSVHNGKIIVIDAGMKDGQYGELLFWESSVFSRASLSGEKIRLVEATNAYKGSVIQKN